jgi:hypothetical protein
MIGIRQTNPMLELSNNLAENSMRPVVVGRKNWIHAVPAPEAHRRHLAAMRRGDRLHDYLRSVSGSPVRPTIPLQRRSNDRRHCSPACQMRVRGTGKARCSLALTGN